MRGPTMHSATVYGLTGGGKSPLIPYPSFRLRSAEWRAAHFTVVIHSR